MEKRIAFSENIVETDVLIIGGGVAGCFAAIKARENRLRVVLVDKAYTGKSGASFFGASIWMVFNSEWGNDLEASVNMANIRGEYINNRKWIEIILKDSTTLYQDLVSWGVQFPFEFDKMKEFSNDLMLSAKYHLDPPNPPWGRILTRPSKTTPVIRKQVEKVGVKIMDRIMVTDLLKQDGIVVGAIGFALNSHDFYIFKAKATILCAGNTGFRPSGSHISSLTGDADSMAYRAGAEIAGREFPDFHFSFADYPAWGGLMYANFYHFTDAEGNHVKDPCCGMELPMAFRIHAGKGPLFWDLDNATDNEIAQIQHAQQVGIRNPLEQKRINLDVKQRGRYQLSGGASAGRSCEQLAGIWPTNTKCAASLPGLYIAGDCCATRAGGAILISGGWSLSGAAVTGKRAGAGAAEYALNVKDSIIDKRKVIKLKNILYAPMQRTGGFSPAWVTQLLQNTMMPYYILHIKHGERLKAALTIVEFLRDHLVHKLYAKDLHELRLAHETKNMILTAEMILRSSLFRTESRGRHYREDYPRRDDPSWLAWIKMKKKEGRMNLWKVPIPKNWWPDLSLPYEERYPRRFPGE